MPFIKIDGSDNRVLRTISDRLDLGPNGPKVLVQVAMTLVILVAVLLWTINFWENSEPEGALKFAPLIIIAFLGTMVVNSVRAARRAVEDGWRE